VAAPTRAIFLTFWDCAAWAALRLGPDLAGAACLAAVACEVRLAFVDSCEVAAFKPPEIDTARVNAVAEKTIQPLRTSDFVAQSNKHMQTTLWMRCVSLYKIS
jgi:hypothetical protein